MSRNETIRKKAQQELLGLESEQKKQVVSRLLPALESEDPFVKKWAAISLALVGPAAQEAIPFLLQNVSAKEKDVVQAARVALSEIGAPDAQQLPSLLRTVQDPRELGALRGGSVDWKKWGPRRRKPCRSSSAT